MQLPIPGHLAVRSHDYTAYTAINKKTGTKEEVSHICYAKHMADLDKITIVCVPYEEDGCDWRRFALDGPTYLKFVRLFQDKNIVPANVEAWVEDGVPKMKVPPGNSIHRAYAALCIYRFMESYAPLGWLVVKICEEMPDLSFYQACHYAMAHHVENTGHNFCNIGITSGSYLYSNHGQSYNLGQSLATALFWKKTEKELASITGWASNYINSMVAQIAPNVVHNHYSIPSLLVDGSVENCDVLNPRWTPLYHYIEGLGHNWKKEEVQTTLKQMYDDITKDLPEIKALREKMTAKVKPKYGW